MNVNSEKYTSIAPVLTSQLIRRLVPENECIHIFLQTHIQTHKKQYRTDQVREVRDRFLKCQQIVMQLLC